MTGMPSGSRDVLARAERGPDRTVAYGDHPDQLYDVRLPRPSGSVSGSDHGSDHGSHHGSPHGSGSDHGSHHGSPHGSGSDHGSPHGSGSGSGLGRTRDRRTRDRRTRDRQATVVVVHGGFWQPEWDRAHAAPEAEAFARDGFHVAVLEYRRFRNGGWPVTGEDVLAGLSAIRADPGLPWPGVLVGHSAGGHLAVWAAGQPDPTGQPHPDVVGWLAGVVSLAGCVDLALTHRMHLGDDAAYRLMDGPPDLQQESWKHADPSRTLPRVPVVLLHGGDDTTVPSDVSRSYRDAAAIRGAPTELRVLPDCGHYDLIDPDAPPFAEVLQAVRELLAERGSTSARGTERD